jgi:hypothetical protein
MKSDKKREGEREREREREKERGRERKRRMEGDLACTAQYRTHKWFTFHSKQMIYSFPQHGRIVE